MPAGGGVGWRLVGTGLCPCSGARTVSRVVESCPLAELDGGLSRLRSADGDAVSWLTSYGSWNAYEKKKKTEHKVDAFFKHTGIYHLILGVGRLCYRTI